MTVPEAPTLTIARGAETCEVWEDEGGDWSAVSCIDGQPQSLYTPEGGLVEHVPSTDSPIPPSLPAGRPSQTAGGPSSESSSSDDEEPPR